MLRLIFYGLSSTVIKGCFFWGCKQFSSPLSLGLGFGVFHNMETFDTFQIWSWWWLVWQRLVSVWSSLSLDECTFFGCCKKLFFFWDQRVPLSALCFGGPFSGFLLIGFGGFVLLTKCLAGGCLDSLMMDLIHWCFEPLFAPFFPQVGACGVPPQLDCSLLSTSRI